MSPTKEAVRPILADSAPQATSRTLDGRPIITNSSQLLRRGVAVIGLAGIALVHVVDATGKFHETPYLGWAYMALVAGCLVVAGMLIERDDRRAWGAAAVMSLAAFAGYALSRTTGLPAAHDDVGNWFEPLGLVTVFAEVVVVAVAGRALTALRPSEDVRRYPSVRTHQG